MCFKSLFSSLLVLSNNNRRCCQVAHQLFHGAIVRWLAGVNGAAVVLVTHQRQFMASAHTIAVSYPLSLTFTNCLTLLSSIYIPLDSPHSPLWVTRGCFWSDYVFGASQACSPRGGDCPRGRRGAGAGGRARGLPAAARHRRSALARTRHRLGELIIRPLLVNLDAVLP